jgi:hypothetical protein
MSNLTILFSSQQSVMVVLVYLGCYNIIPKTMLLTNNKNFFLIVLVGGKYTTNANSVSGEDQLPGS